MTKHHTPEEMRLCANFLDEMKVNHKVIKDALRITAAILRDIADAMEKPINMVLHCPKCGLQHIDVEEIPARTFACHHREDTECRSCKDLNAKRWTNSPHRSHLCSRCGSIWRPADIPTNGVYETKTKGVRDHCG